MLRLQSMPLAQRVRCPPAWLKRLPQGRSTLWESDCHGDEDLVAGVLDAEDLVIEEISSYQRSRTRGFDVIDELLSSPHFNSRPCDDTAAALIIPELWIPIFIPILDVTLEEHPPSLQYAFELREYSHEPRWAPKSLPSVFAWDENEVKEASSLMEDVQALCPPLREYIHVEPLLELENVLTIDDTSDRVYTLRMEPLLRPSSLTTKPSKLRVRSNVFDDNEVFPAAGAPYSSLDSESLILPDRWREQLECFSSAVQFSDVIDLTVDLTSHTSSALSSTINYYAQSMQSLHTVEIPSNYERRKKRKRSLLQIMFSTTFLSYIPTKSTTSRFNTPKTLLSLIAPILSQLSIDDDGPKAKWRRLSLMDSVKEKTIIETVHYNDASSNESLLLILSRPTALPNRVTSKAVDDSLRNAGKGRSVVELPPIEQPTTRQEPNDLESHVQSAQATGTSIVKTSAQMSQTSCDGLRGDGATEDTSLHNLPQMIPSEGEVTAQTISHPPALYDFSRSVDIYMKLHGKENIPCIPFPIASSDKLCPQQDSSPARPAILRTKATDFEHKERQQECTILITENLFEDGSIITQLALEGIQCVDCALQPPIHFIIDILTGLSILFETQLHDSQFLRKYILQLTTNAFKFRRIWIIILGNYSSSNSSAYFQFILCLSSFPCEVVVRWGQTRRFAALMASVIDMAVQCVAVEEGRLKGEFFNREFLNNVNTPLFAARCEFLQLFPSINFFAAAYLLSKWDISCLLGSSHDETLLGLPTSLAPSVSKMKELSICSIGIERSNGGKGKPYQPMPLSELKYVKSKSLPNGQTVSTLDGIKVYADDRIFAHRNCDGFGSNDSTAGSHAALLIELISSLNRDGEYIVLFSCLSDFEH